MAVVVAVRIAVDIAVAVVAVAAVSKTLVAEEAAQKPVHSHMLLVVELLDYKN